MVLFFEENLQNELSEFYFSKEDSRHIAKVLRKSTGDQITITNGSGLEWQGELIHISKNSTIAKKIKSFQHSPVSYTHLTLPTILRV